MEGPSLRILVRELKPLIGQRVLGAEGNTRQLDPASLAGQPLSEAKAWGKQLLLRFGRSLWIRVHFLMFGSYRIDERREGRAPRLSLRFRGHELNFYSCSIRPLDPRQARAFDWSVDPMSPAWDEEKALRSLGERADQPVCDVLLDQGVFSGVGNIIKNEVLFRRGLHPLTPVGALSARERRALVREARRYCFDFRRWKRKYELRKHWRIYRQRACPSCGMKAVLARTGRFERMSFFCPRCQAAGEQAPPRAA
jgi:endonuclease VIII